MHPLRGVSRSISHTGACGLWSQVNKTTFDLRLNETWAFRWATKKGKVEQSDHCPRPWMSIITLRFFRIDHV
jgi:hypothetical protein